MSMNNLEQEPIQQSNSDATFQTQINMSVSDNPMTPASPVLPEEEPKKKRKFFIWFLFALGAFALVQSIIVFSKTDNKDIVVAEPNIEVEQTFLNEQPADEEEEEFIGGVGGLYPIVPAPPLPTATDNTDEDLIIDEEVDLEELTLDDCLEADIVMAGIDPENIDDEVVQQCLILWEDLQDLLDEEEEETATSTVPAIRQGHGGGGGGGGGNEEVLPSADASLSLFDVEFIDVLPFARLQVNDFSETGATLVIADYICSDAEFSSEPCLSQKATSLLGLFIQPNNENISYIKVEIERLSPLLVWPNPVKIWENEEIINLENEEIFPGDIIRVTVIAEDTITENLYKLTVMGDAIINDTTLSKFTIGDYDALSLDGVQVDNWNDQGAFIELCDPMGISCPESLDGIIIETEYNGPLHQVVHIHRQDEHLIWINEDIAELEDFVVLPNDVIWVMFRDNNGQLSDLHKVTIVERIRTDIVLSRFDIDQHDVLLLKNIEVQDPEEGGAILFVDAKYITPCMSDNRVDCLSADLTGIFLEFESTDVSVAVRIYHKGAWSTWGTEEGIEALATVELSIGDIVVVALIEKDGIQDTYYTVSIQERIEQEEFQVDSELTAQPISIGGGSAVIIEDTKEDTQLVLEVVREREVIEFQDGDDLLSATEPLIVIEQEQIIENTEPNPIAEEISLEVIAPTEKVIENPE